MFKNYLFEESSSDEIQTEIKEQSPPSKPVSKFTNLGNFGNKTCDPQELMVEQMKVLIKRNEVQRKKEKEESDEKMR